MVLTFIVVSAGAVPGAGGAAGEHRDWPGDQNAFGGEFCGLDRPSQTQAAEAGAL